MALPAQADEVADFYKGKTITITSGSGAGGGYGVYAMLIRKHFGKYIPGNPNVIVNYNPGGGGVVAADYTYNVAPKDGTAILAPLQSMPTLQLVGKIGIRYDAAKFSGSAAPRRPPAASWFAKGGEQLRRADGAAGRNDRGRDAGRRAQPHHVGADGLLPGRQDQAGLGLQGFAADRARIPARRGRWPGLPLDTLRVVYPDILKETMIAQSGLRRARDFPTSR